MRYLNTVLTETVEVPDHFQSSTATVQLKQNLPCKLELGRSLALKALTQKRDRVWSKCLGLAEIHAQFCKHRHYRKPYQLVSACFILSPFLADELS